MDVFEWMKSRHDSPPGERELHETGSVTVECVPLKDGKHVSFNGSMSRRALDGESYSYSVFHLFWQEWEGGKEWTLWIDKDNVTVGAYEKLQALADKWNKEEERNG